MADIDTVRQTALAMPNVQERLCYGTPAFYVKRTLFARFLEDGDTIVVKIDNDDRERRMKVAPDTFFVTEHYVKYPMMIIRLSTVDTADLHELLTDAYKHAMR